MKALFWGVGLVVVGTFAFGATKLLMPTGVEVSGNKVRLVSAAQFNDWALDRAAYRPFDTFVDVMREAVGDNSITTVALESVPDYFTIASGLIKRFMGAGKVGPSQAGSLIAGLHELAVMRGASPEKLVEG